MSIVRRAWFLSLAVMATGLAASAAEPIRVLIIDGQNNHNWKVTTPPIKADLEATGKFKVDVLTSPPKGADKAAWDAFRPDFAKYDVVLSNYNGAAWPEPVKKGLEEFVAGGKGLVIYHAANNSFPDWAEYNKMIGLNWQGPNFGDRITVADDGTVIRTPKGEGPGAGHGPQHDYLMVVRQPEHPIMKGVPAKWLHIKDELYHGQRGPALHMTILATAFSDKAKGGTGTNEPLIWVIPYGKGRVFVNLLGHDEKSVACVGFKTLLARGTEWAATGNVTIPVPADFPTAEKTSTAKPGKF